MEPLEKILPILTGGHESEVFIPPLLNGMGVASVVSLPSVPLAKQGRAIADIPKCPGDGRLRGWQVVAVPFDSVLNAVFPSQQARCSVYLAIARNSTAQRTDTQELLPVYTRLTDTPLEPVLL